VNKLCLCVGVLSSVVVLGAASNAHAEGFELGARIGYGIPLGKISEESTTDNDLSDGISGMIPLQLDLGYRVIPPLMIGGYVMYGFGMTGDALSKSCDRAKSLGADASCSAHDVRLGLQVQYHIMPEGKVDPWVGAGIGYEWLTVGVDLSGGGASQEQSSTGGGFEFINLQGGADFSVAPGFGLGPFLSLSVAQYSTISSSCDGDGCGTIDSVSKDIDKKAMHEWLTLGVRGTFVL
jgi:hypothetical protein